MKGKNESMSAIQITTSSSAFVNWLPLLLSLQCIWCGSDLRVQLPPNYEVLVNTEEAYSGNVFFATMGPPLKPVNIVSPSGELLFSEIWPQQGFDWKVNDDNNITYFHRGIFAWITRNSMMQTIDTTFCVNGLTADLHDFIQTSSGHQIMIAYDWQQVPMDELVAGGDPNAFVETAVIQELDAGGEVVFEWNALEYMSPLELQNADLTAAEIQLNHANAIDLDTDGNLILSSRNINDITKINRQTGEVMWRWGGGVSNEFTFVNSYPFTQQHSARALGNNRYLIFDNGNYSSSYTGISNRSRAVEFELNLLNMTATVVWEYFHPDDLYGSAMGSVQRLSNGNTLINWGTLSSLLPYGAVVSEVTPTGTLAFELVCAPGENIYRAEKHDWDMVMSVVGCMDDLACNFDPLANVTPEPSDTTLACVYAEIGYDCNGDCLNDLDLDAICDEDDNCPEDFNPDQLDADNDGEGDACDEPITGLADQSIDPEPAEVIACFNVLGQQLSPSGWAHASGLLLQMHADGSVTKVWRAPRD